MSRSFDSWRRQAGTFVNLSYDRGTILLNGSVGTPYGKWDHRVGCWRAKACHYRDILEYLKESGISYRDYVSSYLPPEKLSCRLELRDYQREAFERWVKSGCRGIIVLPTAAGKTFVALKAIAQLKASTLIVVPTLDLIDQWRMRVSERLGAEAGAIGGGEENLRFITVSTYDSAYTRAEELGNRFQLLVFDEAHHLAAPGYIHVAEMYIAPYRMGLTATLERADGRHELLPQLIGGVVYCTGADELAGKHLAPYVYERKFIELLPNEREEYEENIEVFRSYVEKAGLEFRSLEDFHEFIKRTGRDQRAREALLARNRAVKIAVNSEAKMIFLAELLEKCRDEKILIFTLHNDLVYRISRRFLIPAITYQTPKNERRMILEGFRSGAYKAIVTSQVLDEGVDVPDASIGIVLGGTGSTREHVQRLGRLLRKREGKVARLIEVVSRETVEVNVSRRRRRAVANDASK